MVELFEDDGKFFADEKRKRDELSHINYVKDEARNKGIKEGRDNAFREMIIKMKKANFDTSEIKNLTGWS